MFPGTKVFKAVEADRSAFTTMNSPTNAGSKNALLDQTPNKYNDMFKSGNMQSVRHSFLPGNMSLTALQ